MDRFRSPTTMYNVSAPFVFEKIYVETVPPSIYWRNTGIRVVMALYSALFIIGVCGTSSIMSIIHFLHKSAVVGLRGSGGSFGVQRLDTAMYYIFALCLADLLVLLTIPMFLLDQVLGFWMFGTPLCKVFHAISSSGKLLSTFLLVALSFDRFICVCFPHKRHWRSKRYAYRIIFALFTTALVLLSPVLYSAYSQTIIIHEQQRPFNQVLRISVHKCVEALDDGLIIVVFTAYTFVLGYLLPLALIIIFSTSMLVRLYRQQKAALNRHHRGVPLKRISLYTIAIAVFYFVSWTPYWISNIYSVLVQLYGSSEKMVAPGRNGTAAAAPLKGYGQPSENVDNSFVYTMLVVHALPFINSAVNWVLYGLLNGQLQQRMRKSARENSITVGGGCSVNGNGMPQVDAAMRLHGVGGSHCHLRVLSDDGTSLLDQADGVTDGGAPSVIFQSGLIPRVD